jgi:hypothetical protein
MSAKLHRTLESNVPKVVLQRLRLLLRIKEVTGSNLFLSVPLGEYRDSTLKLGHDRFLPNPIYHHSLNTLSST